MKNQNGVALPVLIIIIVAIIVVASVLINYVKEKIEENKLTDLKTNMLLIQADAKKDLEEVCFQTANLNASKEEDLAKINQIKQENLKGVLVKESGIENSIPSEIDIDENCYYLNEEILKEIVLKDLNSEEHGYFIIKYDFDKIAVEVISTKGYDGKYTLTQLSEE